MHLKVFLIASMQVPRQINLFLCGFVQLHIIPPLRFCAFRRIHKAQKKSNVLDRSNTCMICIYLIQLCMGHLKASKLFFSLLKRRHLLHLICLHFCLCLQFLAKDFLVLYRFSLTFCSSSSCFLFLVHFFLQPLQVGFSPKLAFMTRAHQIFIRCNLFIDLKMKIVIVCIISFKP
jgi:hypothetical protein